MNAALGFLLVILAGVLNGSFALPMKRTSKWAWENTWLVYSIVGMVVVNWAIALHTVPELATVYTPIRPGRRGHGPLVRARLGNRQRVVRHGHRPDRDQPDFSHLHRT